MYQVILVAGFVGFRAGVFEHYLQQNGDDSNPYLNEQLANTQGLPVDSPPLKKADSIRFSPEMISTSKSAILIDQHMRFPATDSLKSDSAKRTIEKLVVFILDILKILEGTGLSLCFLALVFIPMENVFPAKPNQKVFRPHWLTDLFYFLGQYLLWGFLVVLTLSYFSFWLEDILPQSFRSKVSEQPTWMQALEVIVLSDFITYWGHRLQHEIDFLWRFHKVHHSAEHMDWLAAHREHPIDSIYTIALINLPAFVFGFPLETLAGLIAFRGIWAIYIHPNVRLPLGPLRMIIGSTELHHWHHDLSRNRGNYANISPLMDIIFGTYTCPKHEPEKFGIQEKFPKNYLGQLI